MTFKESVDCLTAQEFYSKAIVLGKTCLDRHRYSITMKKTFRKAWGELFVFLEANELDYCQETALCWAGYMQHYTTQWKTFRRAVKLFEQYRYTNDIQPIKVYTYQEDKAENLPKWCRDDYKSFIQDKYMEELAPSTVQMYRSACLRFLGYLNKVGISDWNMLTPEIIKDFHFYDPHSTPEARNAYSVKCRYFLEYLSLKGYIPLIFKVSIVK